MSDVLSFTGRAQESQNPGVAADKKSHREVDQVILKHPAVAEPLPFAVPRRRGFSVRLTSSRE
jgi:hypothetical protein